MRRHVTCFALLWIHLAMVGAAPFWLASRFGTTNMMRLLVQHGADPLFVHHSAYYSPRIGSVKGADVGLDAPRLTETDTALMAAVGMGGPAGGRWAQVPAREREAEALEAVKLAVELGVDVNAVNQFGRTCTVQYPPARCESASTSPTPTTSTTANFLRLARRSKAPGR